MLPRSSNNMIEVGNEQGRKDKARAKSKKHETVKEDKKAKEDEMAKENEGRRYNARAGRPKKEANAIIENLHDLRPALAGRHLNIVEVGTGGGCFITQFRRKHPLGQTICIDISPSMLIDTESYLVANLGEESRPILVQADVTRVELAEESEWQAIVAGIEIHLIICTHLFGYEGAYPQTVLPMLHRIAPKSGMVFSLPHPDDIYNGADLFALELDMKGEPKLGTDAIWLGSEALAPHELVKETEQHAITLVRDYLPGMIVERVRDLESASGEMLELQFSQWGSSRKLNGKRFVESVYQDLLGGSHPRGSRIHTSQYRLLFRDFKASDFTEQMLSRSQKSAQRYLFPWIGAEQAPFGIHTSPKPVTVLVFIKGTT